MTTLQEKRNGVSPSLIEAGFEAIATRKAQRPRRQGPGLAARLWAAVSGVLGTLAALVCFTVAAFAVGFVLGMAVAGVSFLLLDFKVSLMRRAAHERGQR